MVGYNKLDIKFPNIQLQVAKSSTNIIDKVSTNAFIILDFVLIEIHKLVWKDCRFL